MNKSLIISRYDEDLDWLEKLKDFEITVYNKGYEKFLDILTNGYGRMPAWGGRSILKKNQIEELTLYLKHIAIDKTNWN